MSMFASSRRRTADSIPMSGLARSGDANVDSYDVSKLGTPSISGHATPSTPTAVKRHKNLHVEFRPEDGLPQGKLVTGDLEPQADDTLRAVGTHDGAGDSEYKPPAQRKAVPPPADPSTTQQDAPTTTGSARKPFTDRLELGKPQTLRPALARHVFESHIRPGPGAPPTPGLHNFNSPFYLGIERTDIDYLTHAVDSPPMNSGGLLHETATSPPSPSRGVSSPVVRAQDPPRPYRISTTNAEDSTHPPHSPAVTGEDAHHTMFHYTNNLRQQPPRSFMQQLKPFNGRLHKDNWFKVAIRPFILYAYPAVLWSSIVYACSIGWLIVLSESVSIIYRSRDTYNFSALSTGLIYLSPFIGGVLGTGVAGKLSDVIVRFMARRNGGLYEPEFRLVMAIPVAITTVIGLMGFGWSAQAHDAWIVPTIFFGIISFGCSLGSTTAITFCVDSYRQYAGEALVTLNFTKNIFHGLVFSLFFNSWLEVEGSRTVFIALGVIQLGLMCLTVPMYVFGKRARMWTVRQNLMERF